MSGTTLTRIRRRRLFRGIEVAVLGFVMSLLAAFARAELRRSRRECADTRSALTCQVTQTTSAMTSAIAAASAAAAIANVIRRTERSSSARPRTST